MPFTIIDGSGPIMTARITGELSKADVIQLQNSALEMTQRHGQISALLFLDNFQGWKREGGCSDLTLMTKLDKGITKIAVVGEPQWRDEVYAFLAKGFRHAAVEFFPPPEPHRARRWLKSSAMSKG